MRQQDAFEFFQYLVKQITQKERAAKAMNPSQQFEFEVEQRLQCGKCHKVRYQSDVTNSISVSVPARPKSTEAEETLYEPVEIYECLDLFIAEEAVEGYNCPSCNEKTTAHKYVYQRMTKMESDSLRKSLDLSSSRLSLKCWCFMQEDLPLLIGYHAN